MEQLELFPPVPQPLVPLEDLFAAYYECRKNKRRTMNALKFEMNLEENLIELWQELNAGTYEIGRSIAFLVHHPVVREVFAANFRDRIIHHWVIAKLLPLLNREMSPYSFSCRKGMGGLYGVRHVYEDVKKCSANYTRDCYVLRLDIRAFFMHIGHQKLYKMLGKLMHNDYGYPDKNLLLNTLKKIIYHQPQYQCFIKGNRLDWDKLPKAKSLFFVKTGWGLPIGNLTSQIFANFYLKNLDNFISTQPGVFYGRYVDDMVVIHQNKVFLIRLVKNIRAFLQKSYGLCLHPRKIILQHYVKGFSFIGAFLLPRRIYAGRRLKQQFLGSIQRIMSPGIENPLCVLNSYFGFLRHYDTFRLRLKGWRWLKQIWEGICVDPMIVKVFVNPTKLKREKDLFCPISL